jgi:hypothetical protein
MRRVVLTEKTEAAVRAALNEGPVLSFGSDRAVDHILQRLRKAGEIEYIPKKRFGQGWQLVTRFGGNGEPQ